MVSPTISPEEDTASSTDDPEEEPPEPGLTAEEIVQAAKNGSVLMDPDPDVEIPHAVFAAVRYESGLDFTHAYLDQEAEGGSAGDMAHNLIDPLAVHLQVVADAANADLDTVIETAKLVAESTTVER